MEPGGCALEVVWVRGVTGDGLPGVDGDRVQGEVRAIALAKQHAKGPLALAAVAHRRGKSAAKHSEGAVDLALAGLGAERFLDELGRHATREQGLSDPIGAPLLELALVLREQAREASVVEVALLE